MGISSLLGAVAFVGFLAFLAGIGLAVVSASQGRPVRGGVVLALAGIVVGILFSVISQGVIVVQPTQVAVVFQTLTGDLENPRRSGTHIIVPVLQTAELYPIQQQEYTMSGMPSEGQVSGDDAVRARTVDGQEIFIDLTVLYGIDPDNVNTVHVRWQNRYQDDFIRPTLRGIVRDQVSRFSAEQIYGLDRTELQEAVEQAMADRMLEEGFVLTDLLIRDVTFSADFARSIEQRQIAEQEAQRAAFRVQQELQEAERVRVQAQGRRDATIAQAEGDAQAIILRAQANAEALRLVSEQVAANPSLIQYLYVQNLSDNVAISLVPSNSPFLFNLDSFAEANADFTAPEVPDAGLLDIDPVEAGDALPEVPPTANPDATPTPQPGS